MSPHFLIHISYAYSSDSSTVYREVVHIVAGGSGEYFQYICRTAEIDLPAPCSIERRHLIRKENKVDPVSVLCLPHSERLKKIFCLHFIGVCSVTWINEERLCWIHTRSPKCLAHHIYHAAEQTGFTGRLRRTRNLLGSMCSKLTRLKFVYCSLIDLTSLAVKLMVKRRRRE